MLEAVVAICPKADPEVGREVQYGALSIAADCPTKWASYEIVRGKELAAKHDKGKLNRMGFHAIAPVPQSYIETKAFGAV